MKPSIKRALYWLPWVVLILLATLYGVELFREGARWSWTPDAVLLHIGLAATLAFALALGIEALEEKYRTGAMKRWVRRLLFWTPRLSALGFAGLLSLLALDVFTEGNTIGEVILAFLFHLIPAAFLFLIIGLAWRWEWIGAVGFIGWAVWYRVSFTEFPVSVYVEVAGLPLVLGLLFLLNWRYRAELRARS